MSLVYFIQSDDARGPFKIGYASNVDRRLRQLQTANASPLRIVFTLDCGVIDAAREYEASLHYLFADLRIGHSEWFAWSQDIVDLIAAFRTIERVFKGKANVHFNIRRFAGGGIRLEPRSGTE